MPKRKNREKIYERNPNTGVIRWRYTDESPDKFGWPNYGRILNEKKHTRKPARNKRRQEKHVLPRSRNIRS